MYDKLFNHLNRKIDANRWTNVDLRILIDLFQLYNPDITSDMLAKDFGLTGRVMVSRRLKGQKAKIEPDWYPILAKYATKIDTYNLHKNLEAIEQITVEECIREDAKKLGKVLKQYAETVSNRHVECIFIADDFTFVLSFPETNEIWLMRPDYNVMPVSERSKFIHILDSSPWKNLFYQTFYKFDIEYAVDSKITKVFIVCHDEWYYKSCVEDYQAQYKKLKEDGFPSRCGCDYYMLRLGAYGKVEEETWIVQPE